MDDPHVTPDLDAGATIGEVLAWLRTTAGLSGKAVARTAGTSQAKVSRIENDIIAVPNPTDVERLARASGADDRLVQRLRTEAERLQAANSEWHAGRSALGPRQVDLAQAEAAARHFKVFQPTVVIGLLQTSGYAAAVLTALQDAMSGPGGPPPARSIHEAVTIRLQRQGILLDPKRQFEFVMTEAVLSNRVCPPAEMPAQINRIRDVARQTNVSIGIIPADARLAVPPFHGFNLMDDKDLFVDLFDTNIDKHDRLSARAYGRVFDALKSRATTDIEPILARYERLYADLLLSRSS